MSFFDHSIFFYIMSILVPAFTTFVSSYRGASKDQRGEKVHNVWFWVLILPTFITLGYQFAVLSGWQLVWMLLTLVIAFMSFKYAERKAITNVTRDKMESPIVTRKYAETRIADLMERLEKEYCPQCKGNILMIQTVIDQVAIELENVDRSLGSSPRKPAREHGHEKTRALDRFKQTSTNLRSLSAQTHQLLTDLGGIIDAAVQFGDHTDLHGALMDYRHAVDAAFEDLAHDFDWPEMPDHEANSLQKSEEGDRDEEPVKHDGEEDPDEVLEAAAKEDAVLQQILADGETTRSAPAIAQRRRPTQKGRH